MTTCDSVSLIGGRVTTTCDSVCQNRSSSFSLQTSELLFTFGVMTNRKSPRKKVMMIWVSVCLIRSSSQYDFCFLFKNLTRHCYSTLVEEIFDLLVTVKCNLDIIMVYEHQLCYLFPTPIMSLYSLDDLLDFHTRTIRSSQSSSSPYRRHGDYGT